MKRNYGVWICFILFLITGIFQLVAFFLGAGLLGFERVGLLLYAIVILIITFGIWQLRAWGRILGILFAFIQIVLGVLMAWATKSFTELIFAILGIVIAYFLLIDKKTRVLFKR